MKKLFFIAQRENQEKKIVRFAPTLGAERITS